MVWAILLFLGVPLWLCAAGITITVARNRALRRRPGNIPVRVQRPEKTRWTRGHGVWVSDVFVWRGSPAAWREDLLHVADVTLRSPSHEEQHALRRLGEAVQIASLTTTEGDRLEVATVQDMRSALAGPFEAGEGTQRPVASTGTEHAQRVGTQQ